MSDDISNRLRNKHADDLLAWEAADEIERLRRELGQVSDADSWVSEADAAHLDSLLNWCEFNDMESHRALQRLVNDRARLRGDVTRLRKERDEARREVCEWVAMMTKRKPSTAAKDRGWDCFKEMNQ